MTNYINIDDVVSVKIGHTKEVSKGKFSSIIKITAKDRVCSGLTKFYIRVFSDRNNFFSVEE